MRSATLAALLLLGAGSAYAQAQAPIPPAALLPAEVHLRDLRQLTSAGENAEAYWSFDGQRLSLQASVPGQDQCDQIYTLDLTSMLKGGSAPTLTRVGAPLGRATCSFFSPAGDRVLFSSTRAASPACPPVPDRSQGYVWPLFPYQIYSARPDGGDARRLTQGQGYEAEATVCRDGSVVFTSDRDGDLELYRMRLDGSGVKRLTFAPGYDGGAFFSEDCQRIIWRAARPRDAAEAAAMQDLLKRRLVRPSRMELWVANADGSEAHAVTSLGAASFAPFFFPRAALPAATPKEAPRRVIFSSNHADPRGREFDLWAINEDGTALERVTHAPEFDGFPMFSPDGKRLVFASNRGGKVRGETNIYLADWIPEAAAPRFSTPADSAAAQVAWLADPAREGRGVGTAGLDAAADRIAGWMSEAGLRPGVPAEGKGGARSFFQEVKVVIGVRDSGSRFSLTLPGQGAPAVKLGPAPMSSGGRFSGPLRFAGYGITAPELPWDDLKDLDLKGQVAVVLRGTPPGKVPQKAERSYSDLRYKAWNLRDHGARAVVFVDPERDEVPALKLDGPEGEAGLPVVFAGQGFLRGLLTEPPAAGETPAAQLKALALAGKTREVKLQGVLSGEAKLTREVRKARNVVGLLPRLAGEPGRAVVLGAHYDHLGFGGRGSFVPDQRAVHPGADDNASGVAALLATAARLSGPADNRGAGAALATGGAAAAPRTSGPAERSAQGHGAPPAPAPSRPFDTYFVAFTGEEVGLVGSSVFVERLARDLPPQTKLAAMINFDMVGRLHGSAPAASGPPVSTTLPGLAVQGTDTASEWAALLNPECQRAGLRCSGGGDGYGPSDMTPFYGSGVPVLFFFTGAHADYHRPSDTADKINAAGIVQISGLSAAVIERLGERLASQPALTYQKPSGPAPRQGDGDNRSYGGYLGTIPDYSEMQGVDKKPAGVKLSGVRPGSPAEKAGVQAADVLVGIITAEPGRPSRPAAETLRRIESLEDMAFVLRTLKPGQEIELKVQRNGKELSFKAVVGVRPGR